jgi:drug/metabolite transporter superfamily protein YnfA
MPSLVISVLLGLLTAFAALARGAHDIWAATAVYIATFLLFALLWIMRIREKEPLRYDFALPLALVIAAFALSSYQAINPGEAYLARMDIITATLLFFIAMNIFQADENILPFLMVAVPVVLLQFITILFQLNLAGTLVNPNIQAGFFLIWVPSR